MGAADGVTHDSFSSLFEFLPIGAYRSAPDGRQLRANPALVRLNGYSSEDEMLHGIDDIGRDWYVQPGRRAEFKRVLERDGRIIAFESEVYRHRTRERIWVSENAHLVRDADGRPRYYEGTVEDITARVRALQKADQLVALTPGMIYRLAIGPGHALRVVFASAGSRALLGIEPEVLVADPMMLRRIRHPDDARRVENELAAAFATRAPWHSEFRVVLADGRIKWVEGLSTAVPGDDGRGVQQRVGIFQDITERVQATQALRRSEQRLQQLVALIPGVVFRLAIAPDGTRRYSYISDHVRELYGVEPAEALADGDVLTRMRHPDADVGSLVEMAAAALRERRELRGEVPVRLRDGRDKWVQVTSAPAPSDSGGEIRVGVIFDITEHKQAEALRLERDRATAANLAKSQFLSRVSHELRTPLNAILGFAQLLEIDPGAGERQRGELRQVLASGRHLLALMDDILDLSSVQTGQLPMTIEPFPVAPLLGEVLAMLAGAATEADVRLQTGWTLDGRQHVVRGDRKRVKQVVCNLLSNAIKYNRPGGEVRLDTAASDNGRALAIRVADDGPGLTAEQQSRLFQPFERLGAQRGPVAGTGLGLALSRQLAEAMGGAIDVDSAPGKGSVFTLRLPLG